MSHVAETDSSKSFDSVAEYSESDQNSSDDNENNTPVYHTLPFKVVGVAHSRKTPLKITITRIGHWEPYVVCARLSVR